MYSDKQQKTLAGLGKTLLANDHLKSTSKSEASEVIDQLIQVLNYHDWRYYVLSEPIIEDTDYDYLFDALKLLQETYPSLMRPDSPTQRVARGLSEDFESVEHTVPMLSLAKAYNDQDLIDWDASIKKLMQEEQIVYACEPKFDGASLALVYENDLLVRAATRGNGIVGDDITNNIKTLPSVPLRAAFSKYGIYKTELRGEVVIHKERFKQMNERRAAAGEKLYSNARNTASGALRQKDSSKVAEKQIEAFLYQVGVTYDEAGNDRTRDLKSHGASIQLLYDLGFKTSLKSHDDQSNICQNIEEVIAYCNKWRETRDDYDYEIDGIVIKVDDVELQDMVGYTAHHPRWAIALKFDARQATTILEQIDYQVGRTGAITPVAKLKTVNLAGANISNASLHNEEFIKEKDIHIGDTVILQRAGDVIPYIVEAVKRKRDGSETPVVFPTHCPSCESPLEKPEEEAVWRCSNRLECPAQVEEQLIHFVSKGAMDIRGLGRDIVKRFYQEGRIQRIPDIYKLNYGGIKLLEGWGERSVAKLKDSIEASKDQPLYRLLVGLGIREVGTGTAKRLVEAVDSVEELQNWTEEQLIELPDIGPKVAASIVSFFQDERSIKLLEELKELGLNMKKREQDMPQVKSTVLAGKTFLFTGSLQQFTRNDAKRMVEEMGGKLLSGVSSKLHYLVVGEKAGSKLTKAQKIETITILNEDEFLKLVAEAK